MTLPMKSVSLVVAYSSFLCLKLFQAPSGSSRSPLNCLSVDWHRSKRCIYSFVAIKVTIQGINPKYGEKLLTFSDRSQNYLSLEILTKHSYFSFLQTSSTDLNFVWSKAWRFTHRVLEWAAYKNKRISL